MGAVSIVADTAAPLLNSAPPMTGRITAGTDRADPDLAIEPSSGRPITAAREETSRSIRPATCLRVMAIQVTKRR